MDSSLFVQNVKFHCHRIGLPITTVCKNAGVGGSFISDIRRGQTPSVAKVQMLAEYLGVTVSDLLGETPTPAGQAASGREEEFLKLFGQLTEDQQKLILAQLKGIADAQET